MAEAIGSRGLGVGVVCSPNRRRSVMLILLGEPLGSGNVSARWSDGYADEYRFDVDRNGHLVGSELATDFQRMIGKLRRLNSVTLRVTRPDGQTFEDTIGLSGSSRAIGQIACGGPREHPVDAIDATMDALGASPPSQRTAERAAVALGDRMREIEEQGRPEYEAALARFAAAAAAADRGDGTWAAALAAGEAVLALATAMEAEMSAIATEMAAVEATAPPEVAALAAPSRMEFEQAVRGMESVVAGLQDQLEAMRTLVADLDRSSHEEATRYEIPLVKVDGGPYFPGERCDSPWVKHTPITFEEEWRGPSDTGWLCESTTSTEGEPTERWCMTTGWEQGFFMCLSGNVDRWLRGWNRNE